MIGQENLNWMPVSQSFIEDFASLICKLWQSYKAFFIPIGMFPVLVTTMIAVGFFMFPLSASHFEIPILHLLRNISSASVWTAPESLSLYCSSYLERNHVRSQGLDFSLSHMQQSPRFFNNQRCVVLFQLEGTLCCDFLFACLLHRRNTKISLCSIALVPASTVDFRWGASELFMSCHMKERPTCTHFV